jgi:ribosomal protein S18 acetylase RimI-like enzyme
MAVAIALFAFLLYAGLGPAYILLIFLLLAIIAYLLYVFSDRLLIILTGASLQKVPAAIRSDIEQYCGRENVSVPLVAIVNRSMPDLYIDGIGKRKKVLMITSGAISQFSERELSELAIREIGVRDKYKAFDMAMARLIFMPINRIRDMWRYRFHMRSDVTLDGRFDEHTTFRKARDEDLSTIYRIGFEAFNDTLEFMPLHNLANRYRSPTSITLVAEYDGHLVGFSIGHIMYSRSIGTYGHGDILAVRKQFRRNGIGRGLTEAFIRAQVAHGCRQMCMEVWQQNDGAIKLYIDEGFVKRKTVKDFYQKGQNADIMCKKLTAQPGS